MKEPGVIHRRDVCGRALQVLAGAILAGGTAYLVRGALAARDGTGACPPHRVCSRCALLAGCSRVRRGAEGDRR